MSTLRDQHYRDYARHYARDQLHEALQALDAAIALTPAESEAERLELGDLQLRRGVLLHGLGRQDEASNAFSSAEEMLDSITFSAHMAQFYARSGNDPARALRLANDALARISDREAKGTLDDADKYYRRAMLEVQERSGRL